jgi:hypothetical protein
MKTRHNGWAVCPALVLRDKGDPGPASLTTVSPLFVGPQDGSLDSTLNMLPGTATMTSIASLTLSSGSYLVLATTDLVATLPAQQFQCQLTQTGVNIPLDITPGLSGNQTRLTLTGVTQIPSSASGVVTLSCSTNGPAKLAKAQIYAMHVDAVNPASNIRHPTF